MLTYSGRTDGLTNSVIIFLFEMTLLRWLTFLLGLLTITLTVLPFWFYIFLSSDSTLLSLHWKILIIMLSQFLLTFQSTQNGMPRFIAKLNTIIVLIRMIFMITSEMLHGRISLNSVLLLLLVNFASGFRLCCHSS